jgi:hypothetical protein
VGSSAPPPPAHRHPHAVTRKLPGREHRAHRPERPLRRREPQRVDSRAERGRHGVEQTGHRLVERAIRDHGRDHRPHADVRVRASHRVDAFGGRRRELEREVVAGGAALAHHLDGADQRREILVLGRPAAADPRRGVEEQLEVPSITEAAPESAVRVGVRVHETREEQAARRVDGSSALGRRPSRRHDVADETVLDDDVETVGGAALRVDHTAVTDDVHGWLSSDRAGLTPPIIHAAVP